MTILGVLSLRLTSKCQVSVERRLFYSESVVNERSRFYPHPGVAFCHWNFLFSCTEASEANIAIKYCHSCVFPNTLM